jgi:hypothetical protein
MRVTQQPETRSTLQHRNLLDLQGHKMLNCPWEKPCVNAAIPAQPALSLGTREIISKEQSLVRL